MGLSYQKRFDIRGKNILYFGQFLEFLSDSQGQWKHLRHQYKIYWDTFRPAGANTKLT